MVSPHDGARAVQFLGHIRCPGALAQKLATHPQLDHREPFLQELVDLVCDRLDGRIQFTHKRRQLASDIPVC
eukprot:2816331-Amphidinium_carterae.1